MLYATYNNYKSSFLSLPDLLSLESPADAAIQSFHYLLKDETQDVDLLSQDLAALVQNNLLKTLQPAEMAV